MHLLIDCIPIDMIIIILVNFIFMFNTSWYIYATLVVSYTNARPDRRYNYIAPHNHIGYPSVKHGLND